MIGSAEYPMLAFGLPPDVVAWSALFVALVGLVLPRRIIPKKPLLAIALGAGALSLGYFWYYLGGTPRIIDATTYLLEARSFAQGSVGFSNPDPTASFRGRFLIHTAADPRVLAGIFPPGYPALLSLGVRAGCYQAVGPLIASAVIFVTYSLAFALTQRKRTSLVAATLSLLCVCLRYHHSETMSHGFSGLLSTSALWATVEIMRGGRNHRWAALLGVSLGLLIATRQLTGMVLLLSCFGGLAHAQPWQPLKRRVLWEQVAFLGLGLLPGLILLLGHQYAVTGEIFVSPQMRYYHYADGPDGCFGLGLSKGCHYEHADVIAKMGGQGLTLKWALLNTLHRLHWHSLDIANFEPLALVAFLFAWKVRRRKLFRPLLLTLILLPLGYSAFYFAGSYPAAGARFFSELLPIWHVLLALGLCCIRQIRSGLAFALLGFSVHGVYSHRALSLPNFGPPGASVQHMPQLLAEAQRRYPSSTIKSGVTSPPLIFFGSAHLFNLAYHGSTLYTAARRTGDDREVLLAHSLGSPETWSLSEDSSRLIPLELPKFNGSGKNFSFESEFDYPPLFLENLWVHPEHLALPCVSSGRALALEGLGINSRIALEGSGVPEATYEVIVHIVTKKGECEARHLGRRLLPNSLPLGFTELSGATHVDRLELVAVVP